MSLPMKTFPLYLESGPRHRKTLVHVLDLLGCVAVGPTTDEAVAATPAAIAAFRRFLAAHGEAIDPGEPFTTEIAEHLTEGQFLGSGSPTIVFGPDLEPVGDAELERLLARFHALREALASWAEGQSAAQLDAEPEAGGRTARGVLLHVLGGAVGGYLSAALGSAPGFSRVATLSERGEISLAEGIRRVDALAAARVRATTPEERAAVRQRPHDIRTLRKALRRMLEHDWEHLAELAQRPGGPSL